MSTINLLYKNEYEINEHIKISIPTVGEIINDEDNYYNLVSLITAMPIDLMVDLDDMGIDFTTINEYELFLIMFSAIKNMDTHLIFGDLDLKKFEFYENAENQTIILLNEETGAVIDRAIHGQIASVLREIHHLKKNTRKPGNKEAKEYMLERERTKRTRRRNKSTTSQLETLIVALVNTEQYKYNYETTLELSIYQFNKSVKQIVWKVDYDNKMHGVYAGVISAKELSQEDFDWLTHK